MVREKVVSLNAVDHSSSAGRAKQVLDLAQEQVGFIPNMYANMVNSPAVLDTYLLGYKLFRDEGSFTPAEQEVVFLVISRENHCEYCVTAHSMLAASMSGVPADVLAAVRDRTVIPDKKLAALAAFTQVMVETRGNPDKESVGAFLEAGYRDQHILSIVLAISVKILSNYSNHLFNTEIDQMFAPFNWSG